MEAYTTIPDTPESTVGTSYLDLAFETRLMIYEFAVYDIDTSAVFTICDDGFHRDQSRPSPGQKWLSKSTKRAISYQLFVPAPPLLLACKQVAQELKPVLRSFETYLHQVIRSSFHHEDVVQNPHPLFVSICKRGRFVLDPTGSFPKRFLEKSLKPIHHAVRSIVLLLGCLIADDSSIRRLWSKSGELWTPFARTLIRMPALEEVGIVIPSMDGEQDFYCGYAPIELCQMLEIGKLQKVRFLYEDGSTEADDCLYMERVISPPSPVPNFDESEDQRGEGWESQCESVDKFHVRREEATTESLQGRGQIWPSTGAVFVLERAHQPNGQTALSEFSDSSEWSNSSQDVDDSEDEDNDEEDDFESD